MGVCGINSIKHFIVKVTGYKFDGHNSVLKY